MTREGQGEVGRRKRGTLDTEERGGERPGDTQRDRGLCHDDHSPLVESRKCAWF